jgi:queuine tRNA-ribosyltransferase
VLHDVLNNRSIFRLEAEAPGSAARAGRLQTLHGEIVTPVFMPVGTQATVKSQTVENLRAAGSTMLLANTYHLLLRPGREVFARFGGIHRFMAWDGPVLTDSGGFQIFSLPHAREMSENGARFQSYIDGRWIVLSPEESIATQKAIGSDIMMVLDQCIPSTATRTEAEAAMELTHRWAVRSLAARGDSPQSLFGIVQGAAFPDLRERSAAFITSLPFDGFAIGGLAVGESKKQREDLTEAAAARLPRKQPRYLMGVGTPVDILEAVHRGVDMFDCIIPTSLAQRGTVYTAQGRMHLRRTAHKFADIPLDASCDCPVCQRYSRAYLHHLIKCEEVLGWQLLSQHNLHFYHRMMRDIRASILAGSFRDFYASKRQEWDRIDSDDTPAVHPKPHPPRRLRRGDYEVQQSTAGFCSIRQISSGETMHSVSDPIDEARRLYVEQSQLEQRLAAPGDSALVIWDVGLGAATNAMVTIHEIAALAARQPERPRRPVQIVSFEIDLDPLRLALKHSGRFPHLHHAAPASLLATGHWQDTSGQVAWQLLQGDYLQRLSDAPPPDLIFYDPFSYKTDGPLWTPAAFARLHQACGARPCRLFTYSTSTAVRAALLWAGYYVARGVGTGPKSETTIAATMPAADLALLDASWLTRWERSSSQYPSDWPVETRPDFAQRIRLHPQWQMAPNITDFSAKFQ